MHSSSNLKVIFVLLFLLSILLFNLNYIIGIFYLVYIWFLIKLWITPSSY